MTAFTDHVLDVECAGLLVSARLNDIEVFHEGSGRARTFQGKLNASLVEGRNVLDVWVGPAGAPDGAPASASGSAAQTIRLRLLRGTVGRDADAASTLLAWDRDADAAPLDAGAMVRAWTGDFAVDRACGRWTWQDAPRSRCDERDAAAIRARIAALHAALAARDVGAVVRLVARRTAEVGLALGVPETEAAEGQASHLASLFAAPDFTVHALDPRLELQPMAGGRLVAVTGPGRDPPLRGHAGGRRFAMTATLTREWGEWVVVR